MKKSCAILSLGLLPETVKEFTKLIEDLGETDFTTSEKILSCGSSTHPEPLQKNPVLDRALKTELRRVSNVRKRWPVYEMKDAILNAIDKNSVVIVSGESGSGKTSQVPQYILDHHIERGDGSLCNVLCVQPRKIGTIASAKRAAKDRDQELGACCAVGYQVRTEKRLPREFGSILFSSSEAVKGLLLSDFQLLRFSHVIVSHIQERDLNTDFFICILKQLLEKREDLRIILMGSAKEACEFEKCFDKCEIVKIPSFGYPVVKYMLEDVLEMTDYKPVRTVQTTEAVSSKFLAEIKERYSRKTINKLSKWDEDIHPSLVRVVLGYICREKTKSSILVILPTKQYVNAMYVRLSEDRTFSKTNYLVVTVDEEIPLCFQKKVTKSPRKGVRKIVLSTDVTESTVIIKDIVYVIDCGKNIIRTREKFRYAETFKTSWIAKSAVERRANLAGVLRRGKSYHLFTSYRESQMSSCQEAEITHAPLDNLCMSIKLLGLGEIYQYVTKLITPPFKDSLQFSVTLLKMVGCLDARRNLTPLGFVLSHLPLNPCLGKMIVFGAIFSCLDPVLTISVMLDHEGLFSMKANEKEYPNLVKRLARNSRSDHIMLANVFQGWLESTTKEEYCERNYLSLTVLRKIDALRYEYTDILHRLRFVKNKDPEYTASNVNSKNQQLIKAIICAGLSPNVCLVRNEGERKYYYTKHIIMTAHEKSVFANSHEFPEKWAVFYKRTYNKVCDLTLIRPMALFLFGLREQEELQGEEFILVDGWIQINSPEIPLKRLTDIRRVLFNIVDEIIYRRKTVNWSSKNPKVRFLCYVVEKLGARNK